MPCYQIRITSQEFQAKHAGILANAAKAIGATISASADRKIVNVSWNGQTITIQDGIATGRARYINDLRVAYSKQAVIAAQNKAKSLGYGVQQTGQKTTITLQQGL